jgi:predicted RNA methylase
MRGIKRVCRPSAGGSCAPAKRNDDMIQPAGAGLSPGRRLQRAFKRNGLLGFLKLCLRNLAVLTSGRWKDHAYVYDQTFDSQHGVDTSGVVEIDELVADHPAKSSARRYEATPPECFHFLVEEAGVQSPGEYDFVDLGSGKGRVLMLAGLAGFRSVSGVELCENLHRIASTNISHTFDEASAERPVALLGDATTYGFPARPTVCFLNNPFGLPILDKALNNIEESLRTSPREFLLIYYHCNHAPLIDARQGWSCVSRGHWQNPSHHYAIYTWRGEAIRTPR